ncbi:hypothetical protein BV898_01671 [Hypsibius exemplaris]|uniref:Uncharacterized protein n=1 Tax=Hypsibius exemplaris TaxID=2072580 RepID=A0A1W0XBE8_HYPEX|nr:hypothetical protein BV898_01671 [Hypsibius exemplaris]
MTSNKAQSDRVMASAVGHQESRDYDLARRASDVDMINPETCDAAKAQSRYRMDRNNSLEQYEQSIHPERKDQQ